MSRADCFSAGRARTRDTGAGRCSGQRPPRGRADFSETRSGKMIAALREVRLITSDRGELKFTHDSLLMGWGRLREQIAEEQRLLGARERLEQYCRRWAEVPPSPATRPPQAPARRLSAR